MFCPACGAEHPDTANFCMNCGRPFHASAADAPPARHVNWEYMELAIPLEASSRLFWEQPQEARARFEELVREHLQRFEPDGWEPEGAVDFDTLKAAGQILEERHRRYGHVSMYTSVTVRLRRQVGP